MKLTVNGDAYELDAASADPTVADLIERLGFSGRPVAVEVNREMVPKRQHDKTLLRDGDTIELVTLVGGG